MSLCSRTRHPIIHACFDALPIFDKTFLTPMCEFRVLSFLTKVTPLPMRHRIGDAAYLAHGKRGALSNNT